MTARCTWGILAVFLAALMAAPALAQDEGAEDPALQETEELEKVPGGPNTRDDADLSGCAIENSYGVIAAGTRTHISFREYANLCAPVLWFSPDEPLLNGISGKDIDMPTAFPFQGEPETPVVYYRIRTILVRDDQDEDLVLEEDPERINTVVDFSQVAGVDLDFFFYYPSELGFGAHEHDVEAVYLKTFIKRCDKCAEPHYGLVIERATAKAHGVLWYDNTLVVDEYTKFPLHLLVEEGKHATCPDKNQDGVYTPTYDVNIRTNDAWGVRDIMRSGGLYAGGYQAWMSKHRSPEYRVFPPLSENFGIHKQYMVDGVMAPDNAQYELRPFPRSDGVEEFDPHLVHFIADKGDEDWPEIVPDTDIHGLTRWMDEEGFINSYSISFRYDGLNRGDRDHTGGLSMVFPLLVIKNVADPVSGGWFVNRIYFKDKKFRDFSWNLMYTPSASRWVDGYAAWGWEWDKDEEGVTHSDQMTEVGVKFRFNLGTTPLGFLTVLGTDFWGLRVGVKNKGIFNWSEMGYAVEFGAGSF